MHSVDLDAITQLKTLLIQQNQTIAVAESMTCGRLQAALGSISGSSEYFEGGITAYNLRQKIELLGIDKQHAESMNSVSQLVAYEMAAGACRLFDSDLGIGTTGYAEPSPEHKIWQPVAYFAICRYNRGRIENILTERVAGDDLNRIEMQEYVCSSVINALLTYLKSV